MDSPEGDPRAYALFAHCFTCTKNIPAVRSITRGLIEENIAVFSFDFTGLGDSEGEFSDSSFATQSDDLVAAAEFLEKEYGVGPALMVGHSLGGTASLFAARKLASVEGIATIGSPADPAHVIDLFDHGLDEVEQRGEARVSIGGRPFAVKKKFIDDLRSHPPEQWLPELRKRLLIFHSPVDKIVNIYNAQRIFMALKHPKSFMSLEQADHLLTKTKDARHVARVLSAWADYFLPPESN